MSGKNHKKNCQCNFCKPKKRFEQTFNAITVPLEVEMAIIPAPKEKHWWQFWR